MMKISLVIPCTPYHFCNSLAEVLKSYENGTVVPDEVVVSLSEARKVKKNSLNKEASQYLNRCASNGVFKEFKILSHSTKQTHGPNRQAGSMAATGDIIIYGDADDIPHPQRVEAIKYCFEKTDAMQVSHWWCHEKCQFTSFDLRDIDEHMIPYSEVNEKMIDPFDHPNYPRVGYGDVFGRTHGGNTAVRRDAIKDIRWKDWHELRGAPAEDWLFCYEVAHKYKKSIILPIDLIKYSGGAADLLWENLQWRGNGSNKSIGAK